MAITAPSDVAKVAHWYRNDSVSGTTTWLDQVGGDDLTGASGSLQAGNAINGITAVAIAAGLSVEVLFASPITQPCDVFIIGVTSNLAYSSTKQIITPASSGTGFELGWTSDGGNGRLYANNGSLVDAPQDGRVIESQPYVFHLRADGAASEVRVNGAYHWSGDFGSDALDGFQLDNDALDYGEIVITDSLLTDQETGELLEYFNGRWAQPDWAPNRHRIALVASSSAPADNTMHAQMRFAIELRGHQVTYLDSGALTSASFAGYAAVVYAGDYADRSTNGPLIRGLIDSGSRVWVSLYESGMAGAVTDTVACACDLVSEVQTGAGFAWGNVTTQTSHAITDPHGVPPVSYSHKGNGLAHAYVDTADNVVGTMLSIIAAGREVLFAIDEGSTDLQSSLIASRIVLSGIDNTTAQYYWTLSGQGSFQRQIDWLLDSISPPVVNTVTSGLRLTAPKYGEIVDPTAGDVTFTWQTRAGRTATLEITTDVTAPSPSWVTVATAQADGTEDVDLSNSTTWPEGIWYGFRVVWDDAVTWTHPGFKLLSTTSGSGFGHVFVDFEHVPGAGDTHTLTWTQTHGWWGGLGDYNGLAAKVLVGTEETSMASPPGLPSGFTDYEISSYFRVGALTSPYFGQSTLYWAAEGQGGGLGLYATGTDVGVAVTAYPSNIFPLSPCPGEGRSGSVAMDLRVKDGAGNNNTFQTSTGLEPSMLLHAWPSPCKEDEWLVPIRLVVHQVSPTSARVLAGLSGYNGTTYWLLDETAAFDFSTASDAAGWVLTKIAGNQDAGGFRDMYTLSVSALTGGGELGILPESAEFPSQPCVVEFTLYEADRTTIEWQVTDDPADASDVKLIMELSNYGAQVVDFLHGSASLATVTLGIIDPPTIAGDQDSGIITGRMHDALARGAIRGRRGRLRRFISAAQGWVTIADGDCMEPHLNASYSSYSFAIRDSRERERKTKAFQRSTTGIMPRGVFLKGQGSFVLDGFVPNLDNRPGPPLAADVGPLLATVGSPDPLGNVLFNFGSAWSGSTIIDERVILLPAGEEVARAHSIIGPAFSVFQWKDIVVWWRPSSSNDPDDWVGIKPIALEPVAWGNIEKNAFWTATGTYNGEQFTGARGVYAAPTFGVYIINEQVQLVEAPPMPATGQTVQVVVQYIGKPTADLPYHWEGTLGELLTGAYDGEFSPRAPTPNFVSAPYTHSGRYDEGVTIATGVRYDGAVLAAMDEQVVLRIEEPVDDLRDWLEKHAYAPAGYAPALDLDGQVSPLHQRFPASTAGLTSIDNSIAKAEPGWQVGTTIINIIRFLYGRLFYNPLDEDGFPVGSMDGIISQAVEVWHAAAGGNLPISVTGPEFLAQVSDSIAQFGERIHTIEADAFHAVHALSVSFDATLEQGWILASERAGTLLPRYAFGTEVISVPVRRDPTATLRAGDWIAVDLSWMPNPQTRRRSLQTYAQLFEVEDLNCAWRFFRAEVGNVAPGIAPTTGSLILTGFAPTVDGPGIAAPGTGVLTLTGGEPDAGPELAIIETGSSLTLTGFAPEVQSTGVAGVGGLILTGFAPSIAGSVFAAPATGALLLSGGEPSAQLTPADLLLLLGPTIDRDQSVSGWPANYDTWLDLACARYTTEWDGGAGLAAGKYSYITDSANTDDPHYGPLRMVYMRNLRAGLPTDETNTDFRAAAAILEEYIVLYAEPNGWDLVMHRNTNFCDAEIYYRLFSADSSGSFSTSGNLGGTFTRAQIAAKCYNYIWGLANWGTHHLVSVRIDENHGNMDARQILLPLEGAMAAHRLGIPFDQLTPGGAALNVNSYCKSGTRPFGGTNSATSWATYCTAFVQDYIDDVQQKHWNAYGTASAFNALEPDVGQSVIHPVRNGQIRYFQNNEQTTVPGREPHCLLLFYDAYLANALLRCYRQFGSAAALQNAKEVVQGFEDNYHQTRHCMPYKSYRTTGSGGTPEGFSGNSNDFILSNYWPRVLLELHQIDPVTYSGWDVYAQELLAQQIEGNWTWNFKQAQQLGSANESQACQAMLAGYSAAGTT